MTSYEEIFQMFLRRVQDHEILKYNSAIREDLLENMLISACSEISILAGDKDGLPELQRNDDGKEFASDLSYQLKDVIVMGMVYLWCERCLNDTDNFVNVLSVNGLSQYSPANLLSQLLSIRDNSKYNFEVRAIQCGNQIVGFRNLRPPKLERTG